MLFHLKEYKKKFEGFSGLCFPVGEATLVTVQREFLWPQNMVHFSFMSKQNVFCSLFCLQLLQILIFKLDSPL